MSSAESAPSWVVLVPLKPLTTAKTRLDRPDRGTLALAMALDTIAAVLRVGVDVVPDIIVVTDDARAHAALRDLADGAARSAHPGPSPRLVVTADEPGQGLNPALAHGAVLARLHRPGCGVAAVSADLPALRSSQLRSALRAAPRSGRGVLADAVGTGTVLLSAAPDAALRPAFGPGSFAAHLGSGAVDLTAVLADTVPGLRRDVDTVADLTTARDLGLGPATAGALAGRPVATQRGVRV